MKTYNEIKKDIEKTKKVLAAMNAERDALYGKFVDAIKSAPDILTRKQARENKQTTLDAIAAIDKKIIDLKATLKFQQHNSKIALYNETLPAALEIINSYAGKPYGEKTRSKISDAIQAKTGCRCYISNGYYNSEIKFYPGLYGNEITAGTADGVKILNAENKIQAITADNVKLYYISNKYFDDIPAAIKAMRAAYKKAVEAQKALEACCDTFNVYAVEGIERIYKDKYIYEKFTI